MVVEIPETANGLDIIGVFVQIRQKCVLPVLVAGSPDGPQLLRAGIQSQPPFVRYRLRYGWTVCYPAVHSTVQIPRIGTHWRRSSLP